MDSPAKRTSSVAGSKREPPHASHGGATTSGMNGISATMIPWPSHRRVHRPPPIFAGAGLLRGGRVEGEARGRVAARPRLGQRSEELAHLVPDAEEGGGHGPRRPADRRLVDRERALDDLVSLEARVLARLGGDEVERLPEGRIEDVPHERRLARPADAGHDTHAPDRHAGKSTSRRLFARAPESSSQASAMGRFGRSTRAVASAGRVRSATSDRRAPARRSPRRRRARRCGRPPGRGR